MINSRNKTERGVWQAIAGLAVNPGSDGAEMSWLFYGGGARLEAEQLTELAASPPPPPPREPPSGPGAPSPSWLPCSGYCLSKIEWNRSIVSLIFNTNR